MTPKQLHHAATTLIRAHRVSTVPPKALAAALSLGQIEEYPDEHCLCRYADPSHHLYVLLKGQVRVSRPDPHNQERELALINGPAVLGHMGLIGNTTRSATCTSTGAIQVLVLQQADVQSLLRGHTKASAALRHLIIVSMLNQLSDTHSNISHLLQRQALPPDKTAQDAPTSAPRAREREPMRSAEIMALAGVLDGWKIDQRMLDETEVEFVQDEAMRRSKKTPPW